jgi:hypothetical protein
LQYNVKQLYFCKEDDVKPVKRNIIKRIGITVKPEPCGPTLFGTKNNKLMSVMYKTVSKLQKSFYTAVSIGMWKYGTYEHVNFNFKPG